MSDNQADIFISYAHLDNKGILDDSPEADNGWVSKFHKHLEPRLKTILGDKKIKIWRDNDLKGNDFFSERIHEELSNNSLLVCIYSPSYLNSPWCGKEVNFFSAKNSSTTSYKIGSKSKIFKVLKMKIDRNKEPELMQKQLGYQFYGEKGVEYDINAQGEERNAYASKLTDLALDLAECLKLMMHESDKTSGEEKTKKVFLADSPDCVKERDEVKRELQAFGYEVLPNHFMGARQIEEYQKEISQLIAESDFYVQLLGEEYGQRFVDSEDSTVKVQHELMFKEAKAAQKNVFTWIKKERDRSKSMKDFIEAFYAQVDKMPMDQGERILLFDGAPIGKLNVEISEYLKRVESPAAETEEKPEEAQKEIQKVFLVLHEKDREQKNFVALYKHLVSQGAEVKISNISQSSEDAEQDYKYQVSSSQAVIIFYGEGDETWLSAQQKLVEKYIVEGGPSVAIYTFEPASLEKEILASSFYQIINGLEIPNPVDDDLLNEFVKKNIKQ